MCWCVCVFVRHVCVCVCVACHSLCSYEHVLYGHRMETTHLTNVCGSPVLREFCVWCGCRTESSSLFATVSVCVNVSVCGVVKGRKEPEFTWEKKDRIWFGRPICKKMKETKLVKIRAEPLPDLPQRFHCSIRWSVDGHRFLLCISSQL